MLTPTATAFFYGTKAFDFFCNAGNSEEQPDSATLITETDVFRLRTEEDGSREFGMDWTAVPGWEATERDLREEAMALDEEALLNMEILSVEDNGDGTLTLVLGEAGATTGMDYGGYDGFRERRIQIRPPFDRWTDGTAEADPWGAGSDLFWNEPEHWYDVPACRRAPGRHLYAEPAELRP